MKGETIESSSDQELSRESEKATELVEGSDRVEKRKEDDPKEIEKEIEDIKEKIEADIPDDKKGPVEDSAVVKKRIEEYKERHLPDYLRDRPGFFARKLTDLYKWNLSRGVAVEGKENIPQEECLVICNHFGGDSESIMKAFEDKNIHFGVAKNIWWDRGPIFRWFLKKLGTIPIDESLSNLTEEEKEAALKRQDGFGQKVFRKIIDREKAGQMPTNIDFVRQSVAALLKGDAVGVYPEGLWLDPQPGIREKQEMKQGYRGIELVASQYRKVTGRDLKIVPTALVEDRKTGKRDLVIGKPLSLEDNDTDLSGTDWCMAHVASMLPEEQRGYYKELVKEIE